ncbi:hypothetical protein H2274_07025 [Campylobacter sp. W0049]|uniref:hypothetical protein n=1 Tax=Campylobacter molothri TaxID=1032242 RepID=UPI00301C1358|nr:hypothetical protein [Campylobacter sp. W0049]
MSRDKNQPSLFDEVEMKNSNSSKNNYQDEIDKKMEAQKRKEDKKNDSTNR